MQEQNTLNQETGVPAGVPDKTPGSSEPGLQAPRAGSVFAKKGLLLVCALVVILGVGGYFIFHSLQTNTEPKKKYTIGLMLPFTGDSSLWGLAGERGAELAKTELGADNFTFIKEDTKCDETLSVEGFKKLVARGAVAVIGETCSSASLAALPEADKAKVVLISPSSSSPELSKPNDFFFRVVPPDTVQGKFAAELVYNKGLRKVALLHSDEAYGSGISKVFDENFTKLGGTVVANEQFVRDAIDMSEQLKAIKAAGPDAIYFTTNSISAGGAILKQIKELGIQAALYTSDGVYDKTLISNAEDAAEGLTLTIFSTGTPAFQKALHASYAVGDASEAYDAFKAIYLAIQKGATTAEEIKNKLPSVDFAGASAHIKFDNNGDVNSDYKYTVMQVKDQQFVPAN